MLAHSSGLPTEVRLSDTERSDRDAMLGSIESGYGSYAAFNIKVRRIAQVLKKAARRRAQGAATRYVEVVG